MNYRVVCDVRVADLEHAINALLQEGFGIWEVVTQSQLSSPSVDGTVRAIRTLLVIGIRDDDDDDEKED